MSRCGSLYHSEYHGRVAEPVIGAQVEDADAAVEQRAGDLLRLAVRQAAERRLHALRFQGVRVERFAHEVEPARQRRVVVGHRLGVAGRDGEDLSVRVTQQNLDEFDGRIPGPAEDCDFRSRHQ